MSGSGLAAGQRVVVEAPATIANLGAGFDCLGLAIDLALRVEVTITARAGGGARVGLEVEGEGRGSLDPERGNRFMAALDAGLRRHGIEPGPRTAFEIVMTNAIPLARGLGSSGAATVAGLLAADALAHPDARRGADAAALDRATDDATLSLATELEGHPDNVAPALLGGLVAAATIDGGLLAYRLDPPADLRVALLIPDRPTSTSAMRSILPADVPRADAVATLGRATTAIAGVAAGDWTALRLLGGDRLHEPYRAAAYPELPALLAAAADAGALMACLAGSGSTVAALTLEPERAEAIAEAMAAQGRAVGLPGRPRVVMPRRAAAEVLAVGATAERRGVG